MRFSFVRRSMLALTVVALNACHEPPQAPNTPVRTSTEWIRITMDDGVTDYPSFQGLNLMTRADTEFDFLSDEEEFGTISYGGCVQNCQDPARWLRGVIDSGAGYFLDGAAASAPTPDGIIVAYDVEALSSPTRIRIAMCHGGCNRRAGWTFGDVATGYIRGLAHSRALAVDSSGGVNLVFRPEAGFASSVNALEYAHCSASCTDSASWQSTLIDSSRYFYTFAATALPSGGMRVTAIGGDSANGVTYFACDSACTLRHNWSSLVLQTGVANNTATSILVGAGGSVHVVWGTPYQPIAYMRCDGGCLATGSWTWVNLPATTGSDIAMALDAAGQPWIATTYGLLSYLDGHTLILHCVAACGSAGGWTMTTVDSLGDGSDVSLVTDGRGQPRLMVSGLGVHYAQLRDTTFLIH